MPVAVIVQRMVNSDKSGVMFTSDPATRDSSRIVIEAAWGLGEAVVQGAVTPDRHVLDKAVARGGHDADRAEGIPVGLGLREATRPPESILTHDPRASAPVLTSEELTALGELARRAEDALSRAAGPRVRDRGRRDLFDAKPADHDAATGHAQPSTPALDANAKPVVHGLGASPGTARWRGARAHVAERRVGHAGRRGAGDSHDVAGLGADHATRGGDRDRRRRHDVACGDRRPRARTAVHRRSARRHARARHRNRRDGRWRRRARSSIGRVAPDVQATVAAKSRAAAASPRGALVTATKLYVNLAEPERAQEIAARDVDGVGLLRAEFMMLEALDHTHPRAFLAQHCADEFVHRMADGLRTFARAFAPRPVIYRAMDFRSNEFRNLTGGADHEPVEANPMIGYRGCHATSASRICSRSSCARSPRCEASSRIST